MQKILVIEDEAQAQKIYAELLTEAGYTVLQALTAQEGLELAKTQIPNLILLDIMLPGGMNGFDVLEALKRDDKLKAIPVVVLTNLDKEKQTSLTIGAADYLVKANSSVDEVVAKIKEHLPLQPTG